MKEESPQNTNKLKSARQGVIWGGVHSLVLIFIKVLRALFIPKILVSLAEYGLFTSVGYFTRYLQLSDLGARSYFLKKIPHYHFNSEKKETQEFINRIFTFTLLSFIGVVFYLALISFFYKGENAEFYRVALLLLIPTVVLLKYRELLIGYSNSIQEYRKSTSIRLISDISSLVFVVIGVYYYGAIGGVVAVLITEIFLFLITGFQIKVRFKLVLNKSLFSDFKSYLNLFAINLTELVYVTLDQTFILLVFTSKEFGLYGMALMVHWLMIAVSNVFKTSLVPKIMALSKVNPEEVKSMQGTVIISFVAICMLFIPFILLGLDVAINLYLTKFIIGLPIFILATFSGVVRALGGVLKDFYIAKDKEKEYSKRITFSIFLATISYGSIYSLDYDLYQAIYLIVVVDLIIVGVLLSGLNAIKPRVLFVLVYLLSFLLIFQYLRIGISGFNMIYLFLNIASFIFVTGGGLLLLYTNLKPIRSAIN